MTRILPLLLAVTLSAVTLSAVEVPDWIRIGIIRVESSSYWTDDGKIRYVDKRRGKHGELGVAQMTRAAFNQIKRKGEQFWMLESDRYFAEECMQRYLLWLYARTKNWDRAVEAYNAGPGNRSPRYLILVRKHGGAP